MTINIIQSILIHIDLSMKIWDIGGQFQFRQNWIDYAKMGDVIVFMVDSSNVNNKLIMSHN